MEKFYENSTSDLRMYEHVQLKYTESLSFLIGLHLDPYRIGVTFFSQYKPMINRLHFATLFLG
jgi:hypothetical protein